MELRERSDVRSVVAGRPFCRDPARRTGADDGLLEGVRGREHRV